MSMPVRVLYDLSPHTLGGTEQFLSRFLPGLDPRLFDPVVVSRRDGPPLQMIRSLGIPTVVVPAFDSKSGVRQVAELIRARRVALTQSNYYSFTLALAASVAGTPHIWRPGGHVSWGSGIRTARDARLALEMMGLLSTAVVCNSRFVADQFADRLATRPQVIPNGVHMRPPLPRRSAGRFRVGMVAHLTPQKRHRDFVRAATHVASMRDDVEFVIYGRPVSAPGSRVYGSQIRHAARTLSRERRFTFSDFLPSGNDPLRDLDLLVLPSIGESFSNAVLEGMAAGVPVIASRSGGNPEMVEHGTTGLLVPPRQSRLLADAVLELLADPARMRSMGRAGRARAQRRFSIDVCVRRYERAYARVIEKARMRN
jgi:glycosyltransferase involved in cell wall biosynthesis